MEFYVCDRLEDDQLRQAVRLHIDSLGYRSFITIFGETFLHRLYRALAADGNGFFVCARQGALIRGFAFALLDSQKMNRAIFKRSFEFIAPVFTAILARPSLFGKLCESLTYARKEHTGAAAELMVIAVEENERSKGAGMELLRHVEDEFQKHAIGRYKVSVHKEMERSIRFYQKNGFNFLRSFRLYGHDWDIYQKEIVRPV